MVDLLLVTTVGANVATIVALIVSIFYLKKEVAKYVNNVHILQESIINQINKIEIHDSPIYGDLSISRNVVEAKN